MNSMLFSFTSALPWTICGQWWNQASCVRRTELPDVQCTQDEDIFSGTSYQEYLSCLPFLQGMNSTEMRANETAASSELTSSVLDGRFRMNSTGLFNPSGEMMSFQSLQDYFGFDYSRVVDFKSLDSWNSSQLANVHCLVNNEWTAKENLTEPIREFWE